MTEEEFRTILKRGIVGPESVDSHVFINKLLQNNQARWSFTDSKLYVSLAAKTLLLDPETFQVALDGLEIVWDPEDTSWQNFWQLKRNL